MRWNVSDVSPRNERRRKGENKDRGLRIFLGSQLSARLGCTGWGYSHLSGCLCMSVSRQGSSTVCNHGNHKDVAPTIKKEVMAYYTDATRTYEKPSSLDQSEGRSHTTLRPREAAGKSHFLREESWELLLQRLHQSCSSSARCSRAARPVYFTPVCFCRPDFLLPSIILQSWGYGSAASTVAARRKTTEAYFSGLATTPCTLAAKGWIYYDARLSHLLCHCDYLIKQKRCESGVRDDNRREQWSPNSYEAVWWQMHHSD